MEHKAAAEESMRIRIEYIQKEFDDMITQKDAELAYAYTVVPLCKKILELIGNDPFQWPVHVGDFHLIDIYYETLYHYYTLHIDKPFPFKLLVLLMIYRPFIYYVVCMTKEYRELDKLNARIEKEIDELFKKREDNERVVQLKDIMKIKHIPPEKLSSLAYMHYFIGFKFTKSLIGVNKLKVDTLAQENHANVIYLNILHNLPFHEKEVYVYREVQDRLGFKFLTPEMVRRYKPIEKTDVPETYNFDKLFTYNKLTETNMFVINYNDKDFTIITKDNKPYIFNQKQATRFMHGALPILISNQDFINYAEQTYCNIMPRIVSSEKVLIDFEAPRFAEIYKEHIQTILQDFKIENKLHLSRFCDRLSTELDGALNKTEKDLFVFYCRLYNWSGVIDKHDFIEYMKGYFDPPDL